MSDFRTTPPYPEKSVYLSAGRNRGKLALDGQYSEPIQIPACSPRYLFPVATDRPCRQIWLSWVMNSPSARDRGEINSPCHRPLLRSWKQRGIVVLDVMETSGWSSNDLCRGSSWQPFLWSPTTTWPAWKMLWALRGNFYCRCRNP